MNAEKSHAGHAALTAHAGGRALKISAWLTGIYFLIELAIGLYTGSVAVISDAFHTFSAVGGIVLAIVAARIARRPADIASTFGSYRAEIVGALLNGVFLLIMALVVLVMGYMRLRAPIELPTTPMLIAAVGGIMTEIISLKLLFSSQKGDLNIRGAFWHIIQTFVGSVLIVVTVLVIRFTGFLPIDPLLGMAFGLVLAYASWGIMREALVILMEGAPADVDLAEIIARLQAMPGVRDAHHVHAWTLTSNKHVFSAHLRVSDGTDETRLLRAAHDMLRDEFGFHFSTLQIESSCLDEEQARDLDIVGGAYTEQGSAGTRHEQENTA